MESSTSSFLDRLMRANDGGSAALHRAVREQSSRLDPDLLLALTKTLWVLRRRTVAQARDEAKSGLPGLGPVPLSIDPGWNPGKTARLPVLIWHREPDPTTYVVAAAATSREFEAWAENLEPDADLTMLRYEALNRVASAVTVALLHVLPAKGKLSEFVRRVLGLEAAGEPLEPHTALTVGEYATGILLLAAAGRDLEWALEQGRAGFQRHRHGDAIAVVYTSMAYTHLLRRAGKVRDAKAAAAPALALESGLCSELGLNRQVVDCSLQDHALQAVEAAMGELGFLWRHRLRPDFAGLLSQIGALYGSSGAVLSTAQISRHGAALCRAIGQDRTEAANLHNLATIEAIRGEFELAQEHYEQAQRYYHDACEREHEATTVASMGRVAYKRRDYERAIELYEDALALLNASGHRGQQSGIEQMLGAALLAAGHFERGEELLKGIVARDPRGGRRGALASAYLCLSDLYDEQGAACGPGLFRQSLRAAERAWSLPAAGTSGDSGPAVKLDRAKSAAEFRIVRLLRRGDALLRAAARAQARIRPGPESHELRIPWLSRELRRQIPSVLVGPLPPQHDGDAGNRLSNALLELRRALCRNLDERLPRGDRENERLLAQVRIEMAYVYMHTGELSLAQRELLHYEHVDRDGDLSATIDDKLKHVMQRILADCAQRLGRRDEAALRDQSARDYLHAWAQTALARHPDRARVIAASAEFHAAAIRRLLDPVWRGKRNEVAIEWAEQARCGRLRLAVSQKWLDRAAPANLFNERVRLTELREGARMIAPAWESSVRAGRGTPAGEVDELRQELRAREESLRATLARQAAEHPIWGFENWERSAFSVAELQSKVVIDDHAALLIFFSDSGGTMHIFVVRRHATHVRRAALCARELESELVPLASWGGPRPLDPATVTGPYLRKLGDAIFGPVLEDLEGVTRLLVVPDGPLLGISLETLRIPRVTPDGVRASGKGRRGSHIYALERFEFAYGPSGTLLSPTLAGIASQIQDPAEPCVVALGDPECGAELELPRLPGTAREIESLQEHLCGARVFMGPAATKSNYFDACGRADLIHIGAHGAVDWDRGEGSGVFLAPDPGLPGDDGSLTGEEICAHPLLMHPVVAITACSATGSMQARAEGVSELVRAWMLAGARALVLASWRLDDDAAAAIVCSFYRQLRAQGGDVIGALNLAKREFLQRNEERSNPYYWGGLCVWGQGRYRE